MCYTVRSGAGRLRRGPSGTAASLVRRWFQAAATLKIVKMRSFSVKLLTPAPRRGVILAYSEFGALGPEIGRFVLKTMIFLDTEAAIRYEYLYRVRRARAIFV